MIKIDTSHDLQQITESSDRTRLIQTNPTLAISNFFRVVGKVLICALLFAATPLVYAVNTQQDTGLCAMIAATNIQSIDSTWSCSTTGAPVTPPCTGWGGLFCDLNNFVVMIDWFGLGVSGK